MGGSSPSFLTFFSILVCCTHKLTHQHLLESLSVMAIHFWELVKFNRNKQEVSALDVQNPRVELIIKFQDAALRSRDVCWSVELYMVLTLLVNSKTTSNYKHPFPFEPLMWSSAITVTTSQQTLGLHFCIYTLRNDIVKQLFWRESEEVTRNLWDSVWLQTLCPSIEVGWN